MRHIIPKTVCPQNLTFSQQFAERVYLSFNRLIAAGCVTLPPHTYTHTDSQQNLSPQQCKQDVTHFCAQGPHTNRRFLFFSFDVSLIAERDNTDVLQKHT